MEGTDGGGGAWGLNGGGVRGVYVCPALSKKSQAARWAGLPGLRHLRTPWPHATRLAVELASSEVVCSAVPRDLAVVREGLAVRRGR